MLCYILGGSRVHKLQLDDIKKQYGVEEVISIFGVDEVEYGDKTYSNLGPKQFLDLLYNATVVCTDSFHGVAFSINFEKEVYAFDRKKKTARKKTAALHNTERITSLLKVVGLQNRFINDCRPIDMTPIDYDDVNKKMRLERKKSWKFLSQVKEN